MWGRQSCLRPPFRRLDPLESRSAARIGCPTIDHLLTVIVLAPVPGALQLLDLALHQVALERADVGDVQLPVEVLGFVQERARQQIFGGLLEHLAPHVPGPYGDAAAAPHLLAESGNTQTALFA